MTEALETPSNSERKLKIFMESTSTQRNPDPLTSDPRIIDLQNELVSLQQDLLNARNLKDPRVEELESQLLASQEDGIRLNEEFKNAMQDFGRIKEQLGNLETENQRLKEISLVQARNDADQANAELGRRLNRSLADVSNLKNQLVDREQRISNLTEQLALAESTRPGHIARQLSSQGSSYSITRDDPIRF